MFLCIKYCYFSISPLLQHLKDLSDQKKGILLCEANELLVPFYSSLIPIQVRNLHQSGSPWSCSSLPRIPSLPFLFPLPLFTSLSYFLILFFLPFCSLSHHITPSLFLSPIFSLLLHPPPPTLLHPLYSSASLFDPFHPHCFIFLFPPHLISYDSLSFPIFLPIASSPLCSPSHHLPPPPPNSLSIASSSSLSLFFICHTLNCFILFFPLHIRISFPISLLHPPFLLQLFFPVSFCVFTFSNPLIPPFPTPFYFIFLIQIRLRAEVQCTPSSTRPGFKLMTFRSLQYISCHWDTCSNHLVISDFSPSPWSLLSGLYATLYFLGSHHVSPLWPLSPHVVISLITPFHVLLHPFEASTASFSVVTPFSFSLSYPHSSSVPFNSYSASHDSWCTAALWNRIMTAQCEGMGEVGSARYEPALLPPCPSIRVLSYSNCQEIHSRQQTGLVV